MIFRLSWKFPMLSSAKKNSEILSPSFVGTVKRARATQRWRAMRTRSNLHKRAHSETAQIAPLRAATSKATELQETPSGRQVEKSLALGVAPPAVTCEHLVTSSESKQKVHLAPQRRSQRKSGVEGERLFRTRAWASIRALEHCNPFEHEFSFVAREASENYTLSLFPRLLFKHPRTCNFLTKLSIISEHKNAG